MRTLFWAALVLATGACGTKDQTVTLPPDMTGVGAAGGEGGSGSGAGGEGGSASGGDGGGSDMEGGVQDASDQPVPCGVMSCMPGEYCCDGTCGACAPIGTNCPADPCPGGGGG